MAYSAITEPNKYMGAYSVVPLRAKDTDFSGFTQYNYLTNIVWDNSTVSSISTTSVNSVAYTLCNTTTAHNYSLGDTILLAGGGANSFITGYYIILAIPSSTQFVIDTLFNQSITSNIFAFRVIKYKMPPSPEGDIKLNLANTLKDFVSENLVDTNEAFAGPDTKFKYRIGLGREYVNTYPFDFIDVMGVYGSNVNLINSGATSVNDTTFNVGDTIDIIPQPYAWSYTDNFFFTGQYVGFTGTTNHGVLSVNTNINVTGQITNPSYNGFTTLNPNVPPVTAPQALITNKTFLLSTPAEPGIIFIYPPTQVIRTATITSITYTVGVGLIIRTDLSTANIPPFNTPFNGLIKTNGDIKKIDLVKFNDTEYSVYNARFNNPEYSISAMDKYVVQSRANNLNFISTILDVEASGKRYRIERNTKSWLLIHTTTSSVCNAAWYQFYDSNGSILGNLRIDNNSGNSEDFYVPVGVDQIIAATGKTETVGSITGYSQNISYYHVNASFNNLQRSNRVYFELNDDCSAYSINHLMWKDALGSWLSMSFKYKSYDNVEAERKSYYQREGNWSNNTFDFDSYGRGDKQYHTRSRRIKRVNSGWLTQDEVPLIEDLFKSASVYLQDENNNLIACTIMNDSIELIREENQDMIQYEFEVKYAYNDYRY
jgi:hypothetical protein